MLAAVEVLSCFVLVYIFYQWVAEPNTSEKKWFYFSATNGLIILTVICNIIFPKENFLRGTVATSSMVLFTFLLPLTLTMIGLKPVYGMVAGMGFVMLIICVCPLHIGVLAFITGGVFVKLYSSLSGIAMETVYKPALAYLAMTGVAIIWRALFMKLMQGYLHMATQDPGKEIRMNSRIEKLEEERDRLRNEIITHVVELNEAVLSHQPEKQEGQ